MSDEYAKQIDKADAPLPDGRSVTLSITMHPNGQVEFNLPANAVLAHGLLGMASAKLTELMMVQEAKRQALGNGIVGLRKKATGRG